MTATYTKLKDDSWGIRVQGGTPKAGQSITVEKKSGEKKIEIVQKVLWTGNGVTLCSVAKSASAATSNGKAHRPGVCVNCGDSCNPRYKRCLDCVDGGSRAHNGQSYYDRNGRFVLGDDD